MAPPNTVKLLEVTTVAPPAPQPPSATLLLTFFDVFWLRFPPNQRLFFYEAPYSIPTFTSTIIPQLTKSLSQTLKHYFPLSGNLTWPRHSDEPSIKYVSGDGVVFTVAESTSDFYSFTGSSFRRAEEYRPLLPVLRDTERKVPVMALQVTIFPNAGFSIGYAIHHVAMDGKTTAMFMHTWASTCKQLEDLTPKPELTPSYDRSFIRNRPEIVKAYLEGWMNQGGPNNKSLEPWDLKAPDDTMYGSFILTKESIEKTKIWVRKRYREKHKKDMSFHLSSYTITNAFVWVCLTRAQKLKIEKANLVISVDCRSRLDPPAPPSYFGNCVLFRMAEANTTDLMGENGMLIAAQAIGEAINSLRNGVLNGAEEWIYKLFSLQTEGLYSVSGSCSFEHYNTDFGWGRPRKVELVSINRGGSFSISDSRDSDGGVEIGVALTKMEIEAFGSIVPSAH